VLLRFFDEDGLRIIQNISKQNMHRFWRLF